jgi:hypothetical protein
VGPGVDLDGVEKIEISYLFRESIPVSYTFRPVDRRYCDRYPGFFWRYWGKARKPDLRVYTWSCDFLQMA